MSWRRALPPALTLVACVLIWLGYDNLNQLRGTLLWELRYVVLGCAVFVLLSGFERMTSWVANSRDE